MCEDVNQHHRVCFKMAICLISDFEGLFIHNFTVGSLVGQITEAPTDTYIINKSSNGKS